MAAVRELMCERCGHRFSTPPVYLPMKTGIWAITCRVCADHLYALLGVDRRKGVATPREMFPALIERTTGPLDT